MIKQLWRKLVESCFASRKSKSHQTPDRRAFRPRLELLEDRVVPSVTITGTTGNDTLRLSVVSGAVRAVFNGTDLGVDLTNSGVVIFNAGDGNDSLIVDFTGGTPIPIGGINFNGQ